MKIYIRSNDENIRHITDLFNRIDSIIIVDDARTFRMSYINSSANVDYMTYSDDDLMLVPKTELQSIDDVSVLNRINNLSKNKSNDFKYQFTDSQLKALRDYYKINYTMDNSDVQKIINMLKSCNRIFLSYRDVNLDFKEYYEMEDSDYLDIIHSLKLSDYTTHTDSVNPQFLGNQLIVFEPECSFELSSGEVIENLKIYVKIDIDMTNELTKQHQERKSNKRIAAIISFHD